MRCSVPSLRFVSSILLVLQAGGCAGSCGGSDPPAPSQGGAGTPSQGGAGAPSQPDASACGTFTDAGDLICCGASSEMPGITCVDLTQDGGKYGIYGRCIGKDEVFEAKIAGAQCCEGLVELFQWIETDEVIEGMPPGCGMEVPVSLKICLECGNQICEEDENACNCPEDCPRGATGAGG
jgi:hypothetical protein